MPRFFINQPLHVETQLTLPPEVWRHIHVLRLKIGDDITLFNGQGGEYKARLFHINKREAICVIQHFDPVSRESRLDCRLAQALSSNEKMEFTLQKAVELGVTCFQPLLSERSILRLSEERLQRRLARWNDIILSACEQCGRTLIPTLLPILPFNSWCQTLPDSDTHILLSPRGQLHLSTLNSIIPKQVWLLAGPEGGFSDSEENLAIQTGWQPLRLGSRILRTETAALAALSAIQTLWGDFSL